jgi:hypothetical protein
MERTGQISTVSGNKSSPATNRCCLGGNRLRLRGTPADTLKDELVQLEHSAKIKDDWIHQLEQAMQVMQHNLDAVARVLRLNRPEDDIEAALRRKAGRVST